MFSLHNEKLRLMPVERQRRGRHRWILIATACTTIVLLLLGLFAGHQPGSSLPVLTKSASDRLLDTVLNETLGFQKIFVINVATDTYRRDNIALAAKLSGLKIEFIDAVTNISMKSFPHVPKDWNETNIKPKHYASWRSHVNAIKTIVDQDLSSALIIEDDVDWDVRIKTQMRTWAQSTRLLVQPLKGATDRYLDSTYPSPNGTTKDQELQRQDILFAHLGAPVQEPTTSAYGDLQNWDVLWPGHCGQRLAHPDSECPRTPLGRIVSENDHTAPQMRHWRNFWSGDDYARSYKNHTRVTSWSCAQVCNSAYALSGQGARKLMYDYSVRQFAGMADAQLRYICDGSDPFELRRCVSVSPGLFMQHSFKPAPFGETRNIRWSVKANLDKLVNGDTDYRDGWPDVY